MRSREVLDMFEIIELFLTVYSSSSQTSQYQAGVLNGSQMQKVNRSDLIYSSNSMKLVIKCSEF